MPLSAPHFLALLLDKPVAILGGGVSGRAVAGLLEKAGGRSIVYDERAEAGDLTRFTPREAAGHKLVVFSPGFSIEHSWLQVAAGAGCVCLCELDFASLFWRGRVLAVTGTNGKTTLTEFLTHALRHAGRKAWATGNIGFSFSQLALETEGGAAEDIAVCEVSSFQAEPLWHFQADGVLWTNFAEDHLERHPGLSAYYAAKNELLWRAPKARVVVGSSVSRHANALGFRLPEGSRIATEGQASDPRLSGTVFEGYPQRENFILAKAWWGREGLPCDLLYEAASSFRLGRHRLAAVRAIRGVTYWNDSKATNFHAVEAALKRFERPVLLIAGGKAKGGDLAAFVERISPGVKHLLLIGATKAVLAEACRQRRVQHTLCDTLDEAVLRASELATDGDNVLLSPGFASFDMFRGYDHRGEVFEQLVNSLATGVAVGR